MPDELLTIFKICFLVLLYLFFFRVLRAVWTEVNAAPATGGGAPPVPPKAAKAPKPPKKSKQKATPPEPPADAAGPSRLVAVDPPHLAGIEYTLSDGMSIGRSEAASIALEDNFLSGRHAEFRFADGEWLVADLGSTNGTYLNNVKVEQVARLHLGDRVQVGNVMLEVH